jgi:DNA adenine methylase
MVGKQEKHSIAKDLSRYFPESKRYFEPFLGGGALLPFRTANCGFAGDIIPELINLWNAIRNRPENVAKEYKQRWENYKEKAMKYFMKSGIVLIIQEMNMIFFF